MQRTLKTQIRQSYERFPYPRPGRKSLNDVADSLVPLPWLEATAATSLGAEPRILAAGCGTGSELRYLAMKFRKAELTGIDFSPRTIACARRSAKNIRQHRAIKLFCGDLSDARFMRSFAGRFDLISCHGVISYVPKPLPVLRNLAHCLAPNGILYLGVNGSRHFSARYRAAAAKVGLKFGSLPQVLSWKRILSTFDHFTGDSVADAAPDFISSDVLAPFINNLSLERWLELVQQAGLHFRGEYGAYRRILGSLGPATDLLFPRSRSEAHQLIRLLVPAVFHRMVLTKEPEPQGSWAGKGLMSLRPRQSKLYSARQIARRLRLESKSLNSFIEIENASWENAFLALSSGKKTTRQILQTLPPRISREAVRRRAFLFYQAGVLNF